MQTFSGNCWQIIISKVKWKITGRISAAFFYYLCTINNNQETGNPLSSKIVKEILLETVSPLEKKTQKLFWSDVFGLDSEPTFDAFYQSYF